MDVIDTDECRDIVEDAYILESHMCAYARIGQGGCYVSHFVGQIDTREWF